MNKRAQFFLIAALILSGIILSFGNAYTTSKLEAENTRVYDLSEEIRYETSQVLDNGFLTEQSSEVIEGNLRNLTQYYASLNPDSDIDIVFGNETELKSIQYNAASEEREVVVETLDLTSGESEGSGSSDALGEEDKVKGKGTGVKLEERGEKKILKIQLVLDREEGKQARIVEREFEVQEGKNFYLVIRKKVKNEEVVVYR
ncbi:hypothetical protein HYZ97_00700 [Candidatus Pacearchaeota archaeon]|nr:hypothetical protein [Candidatus Pacearchaeota archaeon]